MDGWQEIETAPRDGTLVYVRRVYQGEIVKEGFAVFGDADPAAPMRLPLADPIWPEETQAERDAYASRRWLLPSRMYAFPEPTHWLPTTPDLEQP